MDNIVIHFGFEIDNVFYYKLKSMMEQQIECLDIKYKYLNEFGEENFMLLNKFRAFLDQSILQNNNQYCYKNIDDKIIPIEPSFLVKIDEEEAFVISKNRYLMFKLLQKRYLKKERRLIDKSHKKVRLLEFLGLDADPDDYDFMITEEFESLKQFLIDGKKDCSIDHSNGLAIKRPYILERSNIDG